MVEKKHPPPPLPSPGQSEEERRTRAAWEEGCERAAEHRELFRIAEAFMPAAIAVCCAGIRFCETGNEVVQSRHVENGPLYRATAMAIQQARVFIEQREQLRPPPWTGQAKET